MTALLGLAAGMAVVLWRLGDSDQGEAARGPDAAPRVVVTRDDKALPDGCRPRKAAFLILDFFAAYNRAIPSASEFIEFGTTPGGGWYSVSEALERRRRSHFTARDDAKLVRYFSRRHRQHERFALRELIVSHANGLGQIEFRLRRRADDRHGFGRRLSGKGAIDCEARKIVVWSMGNVEERLPPSERPPLCPRPEHRTRAPVACARPTV